MIKFERTEVFGWDAAIRGMRNPMNSWDKSDSSWVIVDEESDVTKVQFKVGENDLKLMKNLAKAGTDHGKFLRMINVTVDITAPLYWWKEFDTYKVGTVANSCSTMHKIHEKEFTLGDFSCEHLLNGYSDEVFIRSKGILEDTIEHLNLMREMYLDCTVSKYATAKECKEKKKEYWWQMIQLLPSSYNQKRTVQLNYEVLRNIDRPGRRRDHRLDEWREFCAWSESLPNFKEVCIDVNA